MTRTPRSRSKVKVTRPVYSPRRLRTGSGQRGNVLSVGNCCYVAVCRRGGARRYGAHTGRRGAGHIVSPRAQLVYHAALPVAALWIAALQLLNPQLHLHNYCVFYAALLPRRGPHIALHSVCPSLCLSVCPSVPLSLTSVTSRHLAN